MSTAIKVFAIVGIVIGVCAIISSVTSYESDAGYAFIGGALFLAWGICDLVFVAQYRQLQ